MSMALDDRPCNERYGLFWFNGKLVTWREANVHILTHALHYASRVFEGQRAYGGKIFALTRHSERLHNSAGIFGFEIPYTVAEIDAACNSVMKANGITDCYDRPVACRGPELLGVARPAARTVGKESVGTGKFR